VQSESAGLRGLWQTLRALADPAIPLVKQLTVLVAKTTPKAARFVHWGATSQDVNDTGLVLQMRKAFDILEADLDSLRNSLIQLAKNIARLRSPAVR